MAPAPDLAKELQQTRALTDNLFDLIHPDSLYERPIPERHRMIFYLGHLEAFDWNLIARYALDRPAFHTEFDRLFAFGIDPPPGELPSDTPSDWPQPDEVQQYCSKVRGEIDTLIGQVPEQLQHVAIEHRLMHAETFAYILHQLDYEKKVWQGGSAPAAARPVHRTMIDIPAGVARLGRTPREGF